MNRMMGAVPKVDLTLLCENHVRRGGLLAEHGLAIWGETEDAKILWDTGQGLALVPNATKLGLNTLTYIRSWFPDRPIHAVMGGMHLLASGADRLAWTSKRLRDLDVKHLYPLHCTGDAATRHLHRALPDVCSDWHVGDSLSF